MTWINPKTNWNSETYINASDFNRIEGNLTHIHGLFEQLFPSMAWSQYPTQTTDDVAYTYKWVIVEGQLENLNKKSYDLNIGNRKTFSENGHYIEYNELNRIENACLTLYNRMTSQIANNTAPVITITSNIIDWTSSAAYDVTGKVTSNGNGISDAYLYYGDNKYSLTLNSSGEFTKRITLQPGVNNLSVRSRDLDGNPRFYEFTKKYDSTLPVITITSAQSSWSTSSAYTVTGKVVDAESGIASATITTSTGVSETALTLDSSGNFSYPITLNNTDNTITIKATNGVGRQSTTTFHAYYDTNPPSIVLTSSTATTTARSYTLSGRALDSESGISGVTVNGSAVSVDANGYFSKNYTLSEGVNTFTAVATDKKGNSSSTSLSVVWVNPATDYGTNVNYNGSHSHQDSANGLSCRYSDDVDNDLNYSVHGSAAAVVNADFYHRYGANYMSLSVNVESGGDTTGSYEWYLMDTAGNVLNSYNSGAVGSGTYGITVNVSAYAGRTDVLLRVKVRSEVGGWVSAYSGDGWSATASMTGCTQSV